MKFYIISTCLKSIVLVIVEVIWDVGFGHEFVDTGVGRADFQTKGYSCRRHQRKGIMIYLFVLVS